MKPLIFLLLLLTAGCATGWAQTTTGAIRSKVTQEGNTFTFNTENTTVRLEFCTPTTVRVRYAWDGDFEENEPWMVSRYDWPAVAVKQSETQEQLVFSTPQLVVKATKSPLKLEFTTPDGRVLSADSGAGAYQSGDTVGATKVLHPDEHFFGFGERMDFLDRRGKQVTLNVGRGNARPHIVGAYNVLEANYSPVPFFLSTRGYGLFLHNSYTTDWDMGSGTPDSYRFQAHGGELDYYFFYGPDFPAILDQYTEVTGKSPLLPRFALGLHVGTYSGGTWGHEEQTSTEYVVALARRFRELGIPVDILHLDSTWRIFGKKGGKGATSFEWRETFDDPKAMFDSLYAMNYNLVGLHLRPRFDNGNTLDLLDQAQAMGYTYPENGGPGEFVNFFDQKSVDWWWENGVMRVARLGARFLKTDEGSAFGGRANESDKTGPTDDEARRLHNVFPIAYAKAPYEKFAEFNGIRGMNHTREGYAGIQRYPFIFAGDWPSEWQYFGPVIKAGLNIGLSGVGYWAHCMGGFEHEADPELYVRWCQFGLMSPVAHLFGMDHPGYKEPWTYGEEAQRIFKKYDELRYQLIPYLYSNSHTQYQTGLPLMRALVLHYQDDPNVYEIDDQYLFGGDLMVCPVTTKGAQTRVVYLPEGNWYDYHTGKRYTGKQYIQVLTPLETLPMLVRGGAIIPMQEVMQYVGEKPVDRITLDVFPEGRSEFTLVDDDGRSLDYQQGEYAQTKIRCDATGDRTQIDIAKPQGKYEVSERTYLLQIRTGRAPKSVTANGKALAAQSRAPDAAGWYFDAEQQKLFVQPGGGSREHLEVTVRY